jgi:lipopolysaccharide export system protein LptC
VKRPHRPLCLLAGCALAAVVGAAPLAPAINWSSNLFTKDNFRSMTLHGSRASFSATDEVDVTDLHLTAYSGDAVNKIETVVRASSATFLPRQNVARGETGVQVTRDDLEATGIHWVYDHGQKKVSLTGKVRIVFYAEIKDILK